MEENPYKSPSEASAQTAVSSKGIPYKRGVIGASIGLLAGVFWAAVIGPHTDGPPSLTLSFIVYSTGFALTGFVVAVSNRFSPIVGAIAGLGILSLWAIVVGPKDGWLVLWLIVFGGSGALWGALIGLVWLVIRRQFAAQQ